jgi:hypothetical protein
VVRWGRNTSVDRDRRHLQGCAAPEHGQALRQLVSRQGAAEQARHFLGARRCAAPRRIQAADVVQDRKQLPGVHSRQQAGHRIAQTNEGYTGPPVKRRRPRSPQLAGFCGCVPVSADTVSGLNAILRGLSLCRGIPFPRCRFGRGISFPRCRSILAHRAAEAVGRDQLYRAATAWHNAALNKMRRGERCCHQQCRLRAGHNQR